jgi:hypothetical protein
MALAFIFAVSVAVRIPLLNKPLSHSHEWLTATVLRHLQIWHQEGIATAHFAPIMTYPGQENKNINNEASEHLDPEGNYFYTSYPPLAYYLPYFIFELLRIYPGVLPLQIFNLTLHFISGLFLYLSLKLLLDEEKLFSVPAVIGFAIYIFSPGTLWFQSNVYMSDMLAQAWFTIGIYLLLRWAKYGPSGRLSYFVFGAFTFCFVYTEWLGVMFAASAVLYAWLNRNRPGMRQLQVAIAASAAVAVVLTILQYARIDGLKAFLIVSERKFLFRSVGTHAVLTRHIWDWRAWLSILVWELSAYLGPLVLLLLWFAVRGKGKVLPVSKDLEGALLFGAVLTPVLHHFVFFNLTAFHDFTVLKDAPFIAILVGLLAFRLWNARLDTGATNVFSRILVCASTVLICAVGVLQYTRLAGPVLPGFRQIGECIKRNSESQEIVFADYQHAFFEPMPQTILYAHRNVAVWQDEREARKLAHQDGISRIVLFVINPSRNDVIEIRRLNLDEEARD